MKKSSLPSMTSQLVSIPSSLVSGTMASSISATPPPLRVELTCTTFSPVSSLDSWRSCSMASRPACPA